MIFPLSGLKHIFLTSSFILSHFHNLPIFSRSAFRQLGNKRSAAWSRWPASAMASGCRDER